MAYTISSNTPAAGQIQWSNLHIQYMGVSYTIADGYTNAIYAYWTPLYPNNLVVTNTYPNLASDECLLFLNKSGTAVTVPTSTIIQGDLIVPGSIVTEKIAADAITSSLIAAGAVTADAVAANAIGANAIVAGAITTDKIAAGAVTANTIAANAIGADKIAANVITADKLLAGTITSTSACIGSLNADKLTTGSITSQNYVANTSGTKISLTDGTIDTKNFKVDNTGNITATSGTIGGLTLNSNLLSYTNETIDTSSHIKFTVGKTVNAGDNKYTTDIKNNSIETRHDYIDAAFGDTGYATCNMVGGKIDFGASYKTASNASSIYSNPYDVGALIIESNQGVNINANDIYGIKLNSKVAVEHDLTTTGKIIANGGIDCNGSLQMLSADNEGGQINWYQQGIANPAIYQDILGNEMRIFSTNATANKNISLFTTNGYAFNLTSNNGYLQAGASAKMFSAGVNGVFQATQASMELRSPTGVYCVNSSNTAPVPCNASAFNIGSHEKWKQDITKYSGALDIVKSSDIHSYRLKAEVENGINSRHIGFVIGDAYNTPNEVISKDGDTIDMYSMASISWKAIKELSIENEELKTKNMELEARLAAIEAKIRL